MPPSPPPPPAQPQPPPPPRAPEREEEHEPEQEEQKVVETDPTGRYSRVRMVLPSTSNVVFFPRLSFATSKSTSTFCQKKKRREKKTLSKHSKHTIKTSRIKTVRRGPRPRRLQDRLQGLRRGRGHRGCLEPGPRRRAGPRGLGLPGRARQAVRRDPRAEAAQAPQHHDLS